MDKPVDPFDGVMGTRRGAGRGRFDDAAAAQQALNVAREVADVYLHARCGHMLALRRAYSFTRTNPSQTAALTRAFNRVQAAVKAAGREAVLAELTEPVRDATSSTWTLAGDLTVDAIMAELVRDKISDEDYRALSHRWWDEMAGEHAARKT